MKVLMFILLILLCSLSRAEDVYICIPHGSTMDCVLDKDFSIEASRDPNMDPEKADASVAAENDVKAATGQYVETSKEVKAVMKAADEAFKIANEASCYAIGGTDKAIEACIIALEKETSIGEKR